jgi:hypothetical protein
LSGFKGFGTVVLYFDAGGISAFYNENIHKMSEFLKKMTLLKENPLKMFEFLKNKYFFKRKSPKNVKIPEN